MSNIRSIRSSTKRQRYWLWRRLISAVAAIALVIGLQSIPRGTTDLMPGEFQVTYVIDGDTLDVRHESGQLQRVRLLRVDTPERSDPFYREARWALDRLAPKDGVYTLELEGEEKDPYGRTLAYVFRDGRNLNLELVKQGWSPYDTRFGEGRYKQDFQNAERAAKAARIGIWAGSN